MIARLSLALFTTLFALGLGWGFAALSALAVNPALMGAIQ